MRVLEKYTPEFGFQYVSHRNQLLPPSINNGYFILRLLNTTSTSPKINSIFYIFILYYSLSYIFASLREPDFVSTTSNCRVAVTVRYARGLSAREQSRIKRRVQIRNGRQHGQRFTVASLRTSQLPCRRLLRVLPPSRRGARPLRRRTGSSRMRVGRRPRG